MRPRISIRGCVRPSVGRSVRRSVRDAFVKNSFFDDFWALLPLPTRTRLMAVYPALFYSYLYIAYNGNLPITDKYAWSLEIR